MQHLQETRQQALSHHEAWMSENLAYSKHGKKKTLATKRSTSSEIFLEIKVKQKHLYLRKSERICLSLLQEILKDGLRVKRK